MNAAVVLCLLFHPLFFAILLASRAFMPDPLMVMLSAMSVREIPIPMNSPNLGHPGTHI